MRKQTKVAALVSAAALLAIGASMTSFAAGWTTDDNGEPTYEDSNGEVDPGFHKNPKWDSTKYYFIDEDGVLVKSDFVEYEGKTYYVDDTGARAKNRWVNRAYDGDELINGTTPDEVWYYVKANGEIQIAEGDVEMVKIPVADGASAKKNWFVFDSEGHMLTGWVDMGDGWVYCEPNATDTRVQGQVVMNDFLDLFALEDLPEDFMAIADENDPDEDGHAWVFCYKDGAKDGDVQLRGISTILRDATKIKWDSDKRTYTFNDAGILNEDTWLNADYEPLDSADGAYYFAGAGGELKETGWKSVQAWYEEEPTEYYFKSQQRMGAGLADGEVADLWLNRVHYLFGADGKQVKDGVIRANTDGVEGYDPGTGTDNNLTDVTANDAKSKAALKTLSDLHFFYLGKDGKVLKSAGFNTDDWNGYATKDGSLAGLTAKVDTYAIIDGKLYQKKEGVNPYFTLVKASLDYAYVYFDSKDAVADIFYNTDGAKVSKTSNKNTYRTTGSVYSNYQPYVDDQFTAKKDKDGKLVDAGVRLVVDGNGNLVKVTDEVVYSVDGKDFAYLTTNKYGVVTKDTTNSED